MSYDSDIESISSNPVTTNTLLGYVDVQISKDEPLYPNDSFIGGQPVPMDANSPIPSELVHCKNCHKPMRLLTQCCAELPDTWYDRMLYVFICIESGCRRKDGSVRAIRGIKKDKVLMDQREKIEKEKIAQEKQKELEKLKKEEDKKNLLKDFFGSSSGGDNANPFASANSNPFLNNENPFDTKNIGAELNNVANKEKTKCTTLSEVIKGSSKAKDNSGKETIKAADYKLPEFKGYILYFETEKLDPSKQVLAPLPEDLKINEVDDDNASTNSVQSGNLPKINPEKNKETEDLAKLFDDQTFQNFTRVLSYNTQQVIRYEPNGSPILYSSKDKINNIFYTENGKLKDKSQWTIPNPAYNPSGHRRFEMQLMPKMIIDLENDNDDIDMIMKNGMEWGTIIVATDSEDFAPLNWYDDNGVVYLEEWCGVQWEDEVGKY